MNDHRTLERDVRLAIEEHAPMQPPNHLLQSFEFNARRKRRYPRWLALIKEPTMRTDSHLVAGSPTARLAAIVIATLLLAAGVIGASFAGSQLLASNGAIIVDAAGDGDYATIQEAVAAAADGDEILIKPGTYAGPVDITKDITVRGEDRESVVLEFGFGCTEDEATEVISCPDDAWLYDQFFYDPWPYGVALLETNAVLSDLTIRKSADVGGSGFVVRGGSPRISGITYSGESDFGNVYVHGGSTAVISDSEFGPMFVFLEEASPATIENSSTRGDIRLSSVGQATWASGETGPASQVVDADPQTVRDSRAGAIVVDGPAVIVGNTLTYDEVYAEGERRPGIDASGSGPLTVEDNHITGYETGIYGWGRTDDVVVRGNTLVDNGTGISGFSGDGVALQGNAVSGGDTGISVSGGGLVSDNVIEDAGRGLSIGTSASGLVSGNRACGNGEDLWIADRATATVDDTNEFCVVAGSE